MVPDPVEEYPLVPVGPALFVVKPPEAETWAPVTFYELPTGERYVHFGVRATPKGGLMDLVRELLADLPRRSVECESPSADLAAVARSADVVAADRHGAGSASRPERDRRSTAAPTCAGGSAAARRGCCCSATTTRSGRSARWPTHPCVGRGRRAARARAAST